VVNNFEDNSRVLDGGGVTVLRTRGAGGGSIFVGSGCLSADVRGSVRGSPRP
jgi:hypothetical protein